MKLIRKGKITEWLQKQFRTLTPYQHKVMLWMLFISYVAITLGVVLTTFF